MPIAEGGSAAELAGLARDADQRASDEEAAYRRLALTLLALELAVIYRALDRARDDAGVLRVFATAAASYRSAAGAFRLRWVERFGALLRDNAAKVARDVFGVRALPRSVEQAVERRAEQLANDVTAHTADRLDAVARAVAQEMRDRTAGRPPVAAPAARIISGPRPPGSVPGVQPATFAPAVDQRLETLVPILGRDAAEQVMATIRTARERGQSMAKVATAVLRDVNATPVTRVRATRIARTETIGLANLTEFELAADRGMTEKHWLTQADDRVRDSHVRCAREGWIPIGQRHANNLMYPGERPAPAEETINCRCSEAFLR